MLKEFNGKLIDIEHKDNDKDIMFMPDKFGRYKYLERALLSTLKSTDTIIVRHHEETIIGKEHKYTDKEMKFLCEYREKVRILLRQKCLKNK